MIIAAEANGIPIDSNALAERIFRDLTEGNDGPLREEMARLIGNGELRGPVTGKSQVGEGDLTSEAMRRAIAQVDTDLGKGSGAFAPITKPAGLRSSDVNLGRK